MIALFLSLTAIAAIATTFSTNSGWMFWMFFALKIIIFCAVLFFILPRATRWFLRRYSDAVMQFIFVMAAMFFSAALADAVGLEGILGAFLSGLILNRYIPRLSPLMGRIEFIGNAIFIPYFLIGVGMLINVRILFHGHLRKSPRRLLGLYPFPSAPLLRAPDVRTHLGTCRRRYRHGDGWHAAGNIPRASLGR